LSDSNPFFAAWTTERGVPPFADIAAEHFRPAFERAMAEHAGEIAAIAGSSEPPTVVNTIDALEVSGRALRRVESVFRNLAGADSNDELQAIERELSPVLAKHHNEVRTNPALFRRVDTLWRKRDELDLAPEQARVLELTRRAFVRAGAELEGADRARASEIVERLASLGTQFSQNVLADEKSYRLLLESEADLAGLPESLRNAAARAAADRGHPGKYAITLARSSIEPFLTYSDRRDLREQAYEAWIRRGTNGGATDNRAIIAETLRLRDERAKLLGFGRFVDFKLDDTMAKTPEAVRALLEKVWVPARARALSERAELQTRLREDGGNFELVAHDWRYYAEKVRKERHDLDDAELKPYLALDSVITAAFYTAEKLFGVTFIEKVDLPRYHPDVRAFEIRDRDGKHLAIFYGDYFARPSKRSGAWMSSFRSQEKLGGDVRPVVVNVMNFAKAAEGEPSLLNFDDARTLFHEFGHGLHGMLSDVTYPSIAGTSVERDFVEFPSQLFEHWFLQPDVLRRFARHVETGKPMPEDLIQRVLAARNFGQGFATVEYCASAILDMDFHTMDVGGELDVDELEQASLKRIGMPAEIAARHRPGHFLHVFAGGGYAAGYYSYLWSEVLDADGFAAFEEKGDPFDSELALRLRRDVYSAGGKREAGDAYREFRGRLPTTEALLEKRGLASAENLSQPTA
jgi:peptidyl-dipeptidase Dcp